MSVTDNENSKQVAKVSINFPDDNLMNAGLDSQACFESVLRGNFNFVEIVLQIIYIKNLRRIL